jgi:hypothetical protein
VEKPAGSIGYDWMSGALDRVNGARGSRLRQRRRSTSMRWPQSANQRLGIIGAKCWPQN